MKPKIIRYKNKEIIIDKEFFNFLLGVILIVSCALVSGVLQLIEIGFDFTLIKTSAFWSGYLLKLVIGYLCLFGCYLLKKNNNKKSAKFVTQRQDIIDYRTAIIKSGKVAELKNWLKNVYNYRKKVELYQEFLLQKNERIEAEKPEDINKELFRSENKVINFFLGIKLWFANKIYYIKLKKYNKALEKQEYIAKQLEVCNIHFQIIDAYKKNDNETIKSLSASIKDNDYLNSFKAKFKKVTYSRIFNFDILNDRADDSIEYNEKKFLIKNILPFMILSAMGVCLLASIVPAFRNFGLDNLILICLNLFVIGWNAFSGNMLANRFCWSSLYNADSNRINILSEFKEDVNLLIDERREKEQG